MSRLQTYVLAAGVLLILLGLLIQDRTAVEVGAAAGRGNRPAKEGVGPPLGRGGPAPDRAKGGGRRSSFPSAAPSSGSSRDTTARPAVAPVQPTVEVLARHAGDGSPAAGATLGTVAYARFVQDIAPFQVGFMVATQDEILTTDRRLQPIGTFAPSLPDQLQNIGRLFHPGKFEILSDGRVIFTSQTFLAMTDPDGSLLSVIEAGQFEQDVFEGPSGFVIVATATGFTLVDPNSSRTFEVAAPVWLDGSSGEVSVPFEATTPGRSARVCSAGVNSTGVGATLHLLGTFDVDDASLVPLGFDMPRSTVVLPIFGTTAGDTPFGDGRLCVSPSSSTIVRGPVQTTTVRGDLRVDLDFMTPGFGAAFAPGTTWTFQWIYRDVLGPGGNGFNGTDAVSLTFQP